MWPYLLFASPCILQNCNDYDNGHRGKDGNTLINATEEEDKHNIDNKECHGVHNAHTLDVVSLRVTQMSFDDKVGLAQDKHHAQDGEDHHHCY